MAGVSPGANDSQRVNHSDQPIKDKIYKKYFSFPTAVIYDAVGVLILSNLNYLNLNIPAY